MTALVELKIEDKVAIVTLNRPEVRNAINDAMRSEFVAVLESIAKDDTVRAVVLTGKGKAFCAGGDIAGMKERLKAPAGEVGLQRLATSGPDAQKRRRCCTACRSRSIAAVNGAAAGLGCDMALACDFIVASDAAMFTMSFVKRGLVSDGGGMYFLPRRVGLPRAKELIFTGRSVDAKEALAIGLADRVTAADTLVSRCRRLGARTEPGLAVSIAFSKAILDRTFESSEEAGVRARPRGAGRLLHHRSEHRDAVEALPGQVRALDVRRSTDC